MFKKLIFQIKLLYFPFFFEKKGINNVILQASLENTKKLRFIGIIFFFVSIISVFNDFLRFKSLSNLDTTYISHSTILSIAPIFSTIIFFYKVSSLEEFNLFYKRNLIIANIYIIFLLVVTSSLAYFEYITFKKQVTLALFVVFINFALLLNHYQRLFLNIILFLGSFIMFSLLPIDNKVLLVETISMSLVLGISAVLSHRQYLEWNENTINKEKLKIINIELETSNSYLNNSKIQLVASNNNLQDFVYAISHDLREPIRISNNLLEIVLIKGREHFTELELKLLDEVKSNNKMMNIMLEDLLEYSKVGNHPPNENVNLNQTLEKALGLLKKNIEKSNMKISYDSLPKLKCSEGEMFSLFQNLINNSIKYKKPNTPPQVNIKYYLQNKNHIIVFQDNGIGIPQNEIQHVFNIFYRAKNTKNISGTGIGLSICKKVIDNLGGQLNLSSEEEAGITLTMQIPI